MAKRKAASRAGAGKMANGKCHWMWLGAPKSPKGKWVLLRYQCEPGCMAFQPTRRGRKTFETVTASCAPLLNESKAARGASASRAMTSQSSSGIAALCTEGDCEYEAVSVNNTLVWQPYHVTCVDGPGCECVVPNWDPEMEGEHAFGLCRKMA